MFALKSAQRFSRSLRVEWEDGLSAHFTYVWLRDNSQRRPSLLHLDLNAKPEEVDCSMRNLSVVWPPFLSSEYSSQFLRDHSKVKPVQTTSSHVTKKVLTVPWKIMSNPVTEYNSHMATTKWGPIAKEHGTLWPHLERVPSIVTVESVWEGGRVHLIDAVECLNQMSYTHPEQFNFLINSPIEYENGFFKATHSTASFQDGKVVAAVFNNDVRSPEITTECLDEFYSCIKTFHQICLDHMYTLTLNPGDLLVVDNAQTFLGAPAQNGRTLYVRIHN